MVYTLYIYLSADVKANKNKKKRSGGSMLQIFVRFMFKTWNTI